MRASTLAVVALLAGVVASCDEVGTATQPEAPAPATPVTVAAEAVLLDVQQAGDIGSEAPIRGLEVSVSLPGIPGPAVAAAGGPGGGFPLVFVNGAVGGNPQGAMTNNVADAVARVAPEGTIRIFPGTYLTEDVVVDKPVTIEPRGGTAPVLVNESGSASLVVRDLASGTVVIRGLEFRNESPAIVEGNTALRLTAGVMATGQYDTVRIEDSRFETAFEGLAGVISFLPTNTASSVTVTEGIFRGGFVGTFASGSPSFEVRGSDFEGHRILAASFNTSAGGVSGSELTDCGGSTCITAFDGSDVVIEENELVNCTPQTCMTVGGEATRGVVRENRFADDQTDVNEFFHHQVLVQTGAEGIIEGNTFHGCGSGVCVLAIRRAVAEVADNEIRVFADHGTRVAIIGSDGTGGGAPNPAEAPTLHVHDNVIRGIGGAQNPNDPESFGTRFAAVVVEASARASVFRNDISNAGGGFGALQGGVIFEGGDNVVENVHTGVQIFAESSVTLHSSDFTGYAVSVAESGNSDPGDLTCNWWGTDAGPENAVVSDPAIYTPWATAEVAGTSTTTCSGGL